jgi:hypothetical protein
MRLVFEPSCASTALPPKQNVTLLNIDNSKNESKKIYKMTLKTIFIASLIMHKI